MVGVSKSAQIAPKILEIMKQEFDKTGTDKIRSMNLMGLAMYNGINFGDFSYQINKLIKKGFVQKTILEPRHVYYSLSDLDINFMIDHLKNDNIMSDYETFKNHVLKWEKASNGTPFIRAAIEEYVRNTIHEGITASSFERYFRRMINQDLIEKLGYLHTREHPYVVGGYLYRLVSDSSKLETLPLRYPTIKSMYECLILKLILDNKGEIKWSDLKSKIEEKCGPISENNKLRRALNNLCLKKYITRSNESSSILDINYILSDLYDFKTAIIEFKTSWKNT